MGPVGLNMYVIVFHKIRGFNSQNKGFNYNALIKVYMIYNSSTETIMKLDGMNK